MAVRIVLGTMTFSSQTSPKDALTMLQGFVASKSAAEVIEIDSARMYAGGKTEQCIGKLISENDSLKRLAIASKANPWGPYNLSADGVTHQLNATLKDLGTTSIDVFYLHAPDARYQIDETLAAVQKLFVAKKFKRFALSNFTAWETIYIHQYMQQRGWCTPVIYQGMYNALTRTIETELLPALRRVGMKFYAYNPLAGGMLTGKHTITDSTSKRGGRFRDDTKWGKIYQERFMKDVHFDAMNIVLAACKKEGIPPAEAALRWMMHHSKLCSSAGDAIIIGASSVHHFTVNISAIKKPALPDSIVKAYKTAWGLVKGAGAVPSYERGFSGSSL